MPAKQGPTMAAEEAQESKRQSFLSLPGMGGPEPGMLGDRGREVGPREAPS